MKNKMIVVRGGGDLATGVIHRLVRCRYNVIILESDKPSAIRRKVAFCEAVYEGEAVVEGITAVNVPYTENGKTEVLLETCSTLWEMERIPLVVDPKGSSIRALQPAAVVDAILAKKNLGTSREMAPLTIGLGPGFTAGVDVDYVVETMRGHNLARVFEKGSARPNTGVPGLIAGYGKERVIHAPAEGVIHNLSDISDLVKEGDIIAMIGEEPVYASLTGVLRGIIHDGYRVYKGMKIADIDPRETERENCFTISDKARCIAGSVVEILMNHGI
ncbi:MAG: EF2563 family selenium-dependent molybdenum hydroxylase system protein [Blautia sp.]|nr:EF2563 family selenium-dependent molybdenum hydroxylase system protein [Blautia sp.]